MLDTDLPLAIDVVCDMLTGSLIQEEDVDVERGAILEEIAMTEDDPGDCVHDLFAHTMFGDNPLGRPVLGTVDTVNAPHRRPHPPLLQEALRPDPPRGRLCRQHRPQQGRTPGPRRFEKAAPSRTSTPNRSPRAAAAARCAPPARVELIGRKTEQAHIVLGMPGPVPHRRAALGPGRAETPPSAAHVVPPLPGGPGERGLAYSVYSYTSGFADCGLFGVYAGCRPSQVHDVLKICRDELDHVAEHGLPDDEIERAVGQLRGSTVLGLEDHRCADEPYRQERTVLGRADVGRRHVGRIASVTPDDVRSVARDVLGRRPSLSVIARSRTSRRPACTTPSPDPSR
ncbi:hypothetical protein GCM10023238_13050 [Streptomyces heliomycini]